MIPLKKKLIVQGGEKEQMVSLIDVSLAVSGILAGMLVAVSAVIASEPRPAVVLVRGTSEKKKAA